MGKIRTLDELREEFERDNFPACGFVRITPEIALEILERHDRNRKLRQERAMSYGGEMLADRWYHTSSGIGFGVDGTLLNGQHRLWGCLECEKAFETLVVWGLPKQSQDVEDGGIGRTASDVLSLHDYTDTNTLAAAVNRLNDYNRNEGIIPHRRTRSMPHALALLVLGANMGLVETPRMHQVPRNLIARSAVLWLRYETDRIDSELSREFWNVVLTDTPAEDPDRMRSASLLRDRLLRTYGSKGFIAEHDKLKLAVLAWNRVYENGLQPNRLVVPDSKQVIAGRQLAIAKQY